MIAMRGCSDLSEWPQRSATEIARRIEEYNIIGHYIESEGNSPRFCYVIACSSQGGAEDGLSNCIGILPIGR